MLSLQVISRSTNPICSHLRTIPIQYFLSLIILTWWFRIKNPLCILWLSNCYVNIIVRRLISSTSEDLVYVTSCTTKNVVLFWNVACVTW